MQASSSTLESRVRTSGTAFTGVAEIAATYTGQFLENRQDIARRAGASSHSLSDPDPAVRPRIRR